jgi:ATP-dependent Clp protease ATP-binding subunit ClpA
MEQPLAIILLDEVDKFHPRCWDSLLGIFDSGRLTLGDNSTVDFQDTIILMTGNTGAKQLSELLAPKWGLGAAEPTEKPANISRVTENAAKRLLRPEMFNRLDKVLTFAQLGAAQLALILDREIDELNRRLGERKAIQITLAKNARELLLSEGFSAQYGARELKRTIVRLVEQHLATEIIDGRVPNCSLVRATRSGEKLQFMVQD